MQDCIFVEDDGLSSHRHNGQENTPHIECKYIIL